ncbi:MAG: HAD family hydrolase [Acidobacteriaceae bacterium]
MLNAPLLRPGIDRADAKSKEDKLSETTIPAMPFSRDFFPGTFPSADAGQTLLFDADDTLWENNVYFEQAIAAFIEHLDHRHYSPAQVREFLNTVERQSIAQHGYGIHSFRRSLLHCFEALSTEPLTAEREREIVRFTHAIEEHTIQFLPGVVEVLPRLAERHRLLVVTKGNAMEQAGKIARSGIRRHFSAIEIVPEKTPLAYLSIVENQGLQPSSTWMIGNSPKSDINPALAAGLHTVFLPHRNTWVLEHEEIGSAPSGQHCLQLERFSDLLDVFGP